MFREDRTCIPIAASLAAPALSRGIDGLVAPSLAACARLFEPADSSAALEGLTRLPCVCGYCVVLSKSVVTGGRDKRGAVSAFRQLYALGHLRVIRPAAFSRHCLVTAYAIAPLPLTPEHTPSLASPSCRRYREGQHQLADGSAL